MHCIVQTVGWEDASLLFAKRLASLLQTFIQCGVPLKGLVEAKRNDVCGKGWSTTTAGNEVHFGVETKNTVSAYRYR